MAVTVDAAAADEAALVARVAAGDSDDPMVALYERYGSRLYGLGMRLLGGDSGMAEEMVQETFVRLWRSAERFDPSQGSVKTFTFMLARRVAIDLRRRAAARPPQSQAADAGHQVDDDQTFEQLIVGLDVRDALSSLSSKHREILELHCDGDLTQERIAERLGIPLGTVKTRTYYGLRALKLELEERGLIG